MAAEVGVSIYCRFRPETMREKAQAARKNLRITLKTGDDRAIEVTYRYSSISSISNTRTTHFCFDRVFWQPETPQNTIYDEAARATVMHFVEGGNAAVFAYGNPSSGKTYTMFGPDMNSNILQGIVPRACVDIFDNLPHDDDAEITVTCSYIEVYNDTLRDLLDPTAPLSIFEMEEGIQVENLTELIVTDAFEVVDLLQEGERFRNAHAGKAHSVCILSIIKRKGEDFQRNILYLVDLCGSSNRASLGAERVNPSLTILGNCLAAKQAGGKIPYTESKLTVLLREIFVRESKLSLIVTCSPHSLNTEETIDALKYAEKVKKMQPEALDSPNEEMDTQYSDTVIENLKRDLEIANQKIQFMMKSQITQSYEDLPNIPGSPKMTSGRRGSDDSLGSSQGSQISERSEQSHRVVSQEMDSFQDDEDSSFLGSVGNSQDEELSEEDKKASLEYPGGLTDGDFRKFSQNVWNCSITERDKVVARAAPNVKLTCWQLAKLLQGIIHKEEKDAIGQLLCRSVVDPENYAVVKEEGVKRLLKALCKRSSILLSTNNQSFLKLKTRQLVLNEIISTERDYVKDLELIIKIFLEPIDKQGILTRSEMQEIFSNITVLSSVNKQFLHEFSTNSNVGEVFMQTANMLKIYTEYCVNHPTGWETLKKCIKKNQKLALFLKEVGYDPNIRGLDLFSFLIKPVQRLCKYPLLVKELLNNTPESHSEYEDLRKAYEKINTVVDYINEKKREAEALTGLKRICAIEGCEKIGLIRHGRELISEGAFIYTHKKKTRPGRVVLLSDMILIISNKKNKLKLKWHSPIQQIRVTNMADSKMIKNSFIIIDRNDNKFEFILTANTDTEKQTWMERIAGLVREYQKRRMLSSQPSSILNPPNQLSRSIADVSMSKSTENLHFRPVSPSPVGSPAVVHHAPTSAPATPTGQNKSASAIVGGQSVHKRIVKPVTPPHQRGFNYLEKRNSRGSRSLSDPSVSAPELPHVTLTPVNARKNTARGPPPIPPARDPSGPTSPPSNGTSSPPSSPPPARDDPTVPMPRPPMSPRPQIKYAVRVRELNVRRMELKNSESDEMNSPPLSPSNSASSVGDATK